MCVKKARPLCNTHNISWTVSKGGGKLACVRVCRPAVSALCQPAAGKRFSGGTSGTPHRSLRSSCGRIIHRRRRPEAHRVALDTPPRVTPLGSSPRQRARNKMYIFVHYIYICAVYGAHACFTVNLTTQHLHRGSAFLSCRHAGGGHDWVYIKITWIQN